MISKIYSSSLQGVNAVEIEIEVNITQGDPKTIIVGLPDASVRESGVRVNSAMIASGFSRSGGKVVINLAPANLKKEGSGFDLAIAIGIIMANESVSESFDSYCLVGELALNGELRHNKGCLSHAIEARNQGKEYFICSEKSAKEASFVKDIKVIPVKNLREAYSFLKNDNIIEPLKHPVFDGIISDYDDMEDVKGQSSAKRAFEIAASGGHNLLMIGPPGTGKSMLSKRIPSILPNMEEDEILETTKIHSIRGLIDENQGVINARPFRSPHHTISDAGLLGGGSNPKPGEISLAHNGVLFLDELPEFRRTTLEVLRQPLEDGYITISRASGTMTFPSKFMLIAAMNPCPCGYFGDLNRKCRCSHIQVDNYRNRISGPLLDRIDIHIEIPRIEFRKFINKKTETSEQIRQRVKAARNIQIKRFASEKNINCNAVMPSKLLKTFCDLDKTSGDFLHQVIQDLQISARGHDKILKISRTIADLDNSKTIQQHHLMEAVQYRTLDKTKW